MRNTLSNLNGFPTDNSPSTQLKYDIVASKFMNGIESHQKKESTKTDISSIFWIAQSDIAINNCYCTNYRVPTEMDL